MSDILRVQWTIVHRTAPQPWLTCSRCSEPRRFRSSDKIRVNANGKRLDAWLIYKCTGCGSTWNRPILERRPVRTIEPDLLAALHASDAELTRRLAFDVEGLSRSAARVEKFGDALVTKAVLSASTTPARQLEILCRVPEPIGLRLDRLLANELRLSRSRIQGMATTGDLAVFPSVSSLHRPVRDGVRLVLGCLSDALVHATSGAYPTKINTPRALTYTPANITNVANSRPSTSRRLPSQAFNRVPATAPAAPPAISRAAVGQSTRPDQA